MTYLYYEPGQYKAIEVYMAAWVATIRKGGGPSKNADCFSDFVSSTFCM
jgi:hypothetical protein